MLKVPDHLEPPSGIEPLYKRFAGAGVTITLSRHCGFNPLRIVLNPEDWSPLLPYVFLSEW